MSLTQAIQQIVERLRAEEASALVDVARRAGTFSPWAAVLFPIPLWAFVALMGALLGAAGGVIFVRRPAASMS